MAPHIRPLLPDVVNRIAAGEIIIAPSNALKELIENSIDAGSTHIEISAKEGGLKLLQITDNGSGIDKGDFGMLCERHATSKLTKFEDLQAISTYGFRGEALASISHVSHLSVVSKTSQDDCAWKCYYSLGKLVPPPTGGSSDPRPIAGKDGTSLIVEDLFYNVPSRLRALHSHTQEYGKMVEVASKYAIHTEGVGFTCKKQGTAQMDLAIRSNMSQKDRIRTVYGSGVANELLQVEIPPNSDIGLVGCRGMVTSPNYTNKKSTPPVLFINSRLVVCDPIRRAVNNLYSQYLPKHHRPFVYLSLQLNPADVDVNVHPTKREVRFLHEEEIVQAIVGGIESCLSSVDSSRKFLTQQVMSQPAARLTQQTLVDEDELPPQKKRKSVKSIKDFRKPYEKDMVRTDFNQSTLSSFVRPELPKEIESSQIVRPSSEADEVVEIVSDEEPDILYQSTQKSQPLTHLPRTASEAQLFVQRTSSAIPESSDLSSSRPSSSHLSSSRPSSSSSATIVNLNSVKELRKQVQDSADLELTNLFSKHTFIGIADYSRRLMCLQYERQLYLVDYGAVCNEFFYQIGLSDFANYGKIRFNNPVDIRALLQSEIYSNMEILDRYPDAPTLDELITTVFVEMASMLEEYFSMEIDLSADAHNPKLVTLPMLLKNYVPSFSKLSLFLFKLGAAVDWEDEQECLAGVLRQISLFYIPEPLEDQPQEEDRRNYTKHVLENELFPLIKKRFIATENLGRDVVEIANLPGLYKVFERC